MATAAPLLERTIAEASTREPRDWKIAAISMLVFGGSVGALFALQTLLLGGSPIPSGGWELDVSIAGGVLWCVPVLAGVLSWMGMLSQRKPPPPARPDDPPLRNVVSFRYMSRGTNPDSLRSSVASVHEVMKRLPLFPYIIEVCVEVPQENLPEGTIEMLLPASYRTANGTLYKGRALQYAMERSEIADDAWIMHCDEESHIHESLVQGIYRAIREEEASGRHRIGQGCILYYNSLEKHPFLTLADSVRTGDDIGRFHLQNRHWHLPVWGFHGSFILVRNSVEKMTGFDFGPHGSITEDAFWALASAQRGARSRWVDGFMVEQGTERVIDFIKQRRRWYVGLLKVVLHSPAHWRLRLPLAVFTALWSVSWLAILYTYFDYIVGWRSTGCVQVIGNISFSTYVCIYVIGLRTNLLLYKASLLRKIALYAAQVLCIPFFAIMESLGVLYALVRPEKGFHVVQKHMVAPDVVTVDAA